MKQPKKPPPDTVGNVRGRIAALRQQARRNATMDEGNYDRALARHMRAIEPQLKKLRVRLAKAKKLEPETTVVPLQKATRRSRKRSKVAAPTKAANGDDDLLSVLDAL